MISPLSVSGRKIFASLSEAKHRREHGMFAVEGERSLREMMGGRLECRAIVATSRWWQTVGTGLIQLERVERFLASAKEMRQLSTLVSAPEVIGYFSVPQNIEFDESRAVVELILALDDVQDPGNMGTILRLADWWGVDTVLCSPGTVDAFNPKVVQSAMGALARVEVLKTPEFYRILEKIGNSGVPIYGTFLGGENLFEASLSTNGLVVMGNEGNGIGKQTAASVTRRLTIPSYPEGRRHVESLNVATATAIILARFRSAFLSKP